MTRTPWVRVPRRSRGYQSSGPNHRLRRWLAVELHRLRPLIAVSAAACHAEKYRKHFTSFMHGCVLLFHGLSHGRSLTQSYAAFGACHGLLTLSGLALTDDPTDERLRVSFSQLAASNTSRPSDFLAGLVPFLAARVRARGDVSAARLPRDLQMLDGTFLRLSLKLAPWLPNNGSNDVPGVRVQMQYAPGDDLPTFLCLTDSHTSDRQAFDRLVDAADGPLDAWRGQTLVMDLGYYGHRRFARLLRAGVHLVTRLLGQASYVVACDKPVQAPLPTLAAPPIQIHSDQRIWLGSPLNTAGAVLPNIRLVVATVQPDPKAARTGAQPVVYDLITDRWDLTAREVVQIYLWRWQIELFFRWLKHHVHLLKPLGYSRAALELTVWVSLIVHLLSVLAAHALGHDRRTPPLLAQILWAFAHLTPTDLVPEEPAGYQLAFGEVPLPSGASP